MLCSISDFLGKWVNLANTNVAPRQGTMLEMIWKVKEFRHKRFMRTASAHYNVSNISARGTLTQFFTVR
jgi:hypothetical protein